MKTFMAKPSDISKRWWVVDADGRVLGRLATRLALILQGKHRPTYTPHIDTGDHVVVVNAAKLKLTGRKVEQKSHQYYTGYPSGQREIPYAELMVRDPARVLRLAVKRMLPKTNLGRLMLAKLRIYEGAEHPHCAQQPEPLDP